MPDPDRVLRKRISALSPADRKSLLDKLRENKPSGTGNVVVNLASKARPLRTETGSGARVYPAAPTQERMYFLHEFTGRTTTYSTSARFQLEGRVDAGKLEKAFQSVINRHDSLRTRFAMEDGVLCQHVLPDQEFSLQQVAAAGSTIHGRERDAERIIRGLADLPFDLNQGPLFRAVLLMVEPELFELVIFSHHIITDGWSFNVLLREVSACYNANARGQSVQLPELPLQLPDFCAWQIGQLKTGAWEDSFTYWENNLRDEPDPLEYPWDFERKPNSQNEGGNFFRTIEPALLAKLEDLSGQHQATLFMVLLAAFKVHVMRHTGETDLIVGVPIANRLRKESESLIGCLINTLALRTDCSGNPSFSELLARVRRTSLNAFPHQELPFDRVIKRLKVRRHPGRPPLFQTHFTLQNFPPAPLELLGIRALQKPLGHERSKFDFSIAVERNSGGWRSKIDYNRGVFAEKTACALADSWEELLTRISERPEDPIADLASLRRTGRPGASGSVEPAQECLHAQFERQVRNKPEAVAVACEGRTISFRELNEYANRVAHRLIDLGVGTEAVVGICTQRSFEMVAGILGILKSGAAFLPLDPDWPTSRTMQIIKDSGLQTIVTVSDFSLHKKLPHCNIICADDLAVAGDPRTTDPSQQVDPCNLAYILYTSGSTGAPKGVMVEHRHLDAYLTGLTRTIPYGDGAYAMAQPLTADASQTMLMTPLLRGGCLHLVTRECSLNPRKLSRYFQDNGIDYFKITPTHLGTLLDILPSAGLFPRKILMLGGEALPVDLVRKIRSLEPRCRIWNHYGPTETTVGVLAHEITTIPEEQLGLTMPIGHPFPGVSVHILDENGQPLPDGESGEIHIGGSTVTRGYLNNPEQTAKAFIEQAMDSGPTQRLYRTGDKGFVLPDGAIQFTGRLDDQVKIRGYRVEPGEIEAALREFPGIRNQVVLPTKAPSGESCLIAFVVPSEGNELAPEPIRNFLAEHLPEPLVPSTIRIIDGIPITPMGKTDRKALMDRLDQQSYGSPADSNRPGQQGSINTIIKACRDVLGVAPVDGHQSFFDLGGTSLGAMRLTARLEECLGLEVPLRLLFDTASLDGLAAAIDKLIVAEKDILQGSAVRSGCAHFRFEHQVDLTPEAIAVEGCGQSLSYAELNARSNRLAHQLRERGVGRDDLVAIQMNRSPDMIVAVLAILKAGGACLPVDINNPAKRIRSILEDAHPATILCNDTDFSHLLPAETQTILIDDAILISGNSTNPDWPINSGDLAYVLYTSGSTGEPKGVQVPHRTLDNLISWQVKDSPCDERDRTLQFASLGFDVSFQEIFSTLSEGGRLILVDDDTRRDVSRLVAVLSKGRISRLFLPYVALDAIAAEALRLDIYLPDLKEIITAGEQLKITPAIRSFFLKHSDTVLKNQYGPTETHVVTSYTVRGNPLDWPTLPAIGKPIDNTRIYLLDENMEEVPTGTEGEIHVGGTPVSRGYLRREALTQSKFIHSPLDPSGPLYRTGDLAKQHEDGSFQFLGRNDEQIKFRGYRIELGEIETRIMQLSGVQECVVLAREYGDENKQLAAYLIADKGICAQTVREHLKGLLPDYMVPSAIEFVPSFPLNQNGKVDRQGLAARPMVPDMQAQTDAIDLKRTQDAITRIWCESLERDSIQSDENFFRIGGHSLLATKVVSRIRAELVPDCTIRLLFENPTISGLSKTIVALMNGQADHLVADRFDTKPQRRAPEAYPASYAQQRLWFIDQFEGGSQQYLMPLVFIIRGFLNVKALEMALNVIVQRHQTLHTHFEDRDGLLYQVVDDAPRIDLMGTIQDAREGQSLEEAAQSAYSEERSKEFDLSRSPLFRVRLVRTGTGEHLFLASFHHVISDGWSNGVFLRELRQLYHGFANGADSSLEPLTTRYTDYSQWQREWLQGERLEEQKAFWKTYLEGAGLQDMPSDYPRPTQLSYKGSRISFKLSGNLSAKLKKFNLAERTTPFMSLMAAFQVLLFRYSGQTDITVGTPIANRRKVEFEKLIGFFVNTLVIRTKLSGDAGFNDIVKTVRDSALDAFAHQDFPFEKMVECVNPPRRTNRHPLFQVLFALQNTPREPFELDDLGIEPYHPPGVSTHFDMEMHLTQRGDEWLGSLNYSTDLFNENTARKLVDTFPILLEQLLDAPSQPVSRIELSEQDGLCPVEPAEKPQALSEPASDPVHAVFTGPRTALEQQICKVWEEVLNLKQVGVHDNFFEIGGHSLLATQIVSRISPIIGHHVPVKAVFDNPTVSSLALYSPKEKSADSGTREPDITGETYEPISFIQQRIWFMEKFDAGSPQYHMPELLHLKGPLNTTALELAVNTIISRHDPLRTAFREIDHQVMQVIVPNLTVSIEKESIKTGPDQSFAETARQAATDTCTLPFRMDKAPLVRAKLYSNGEQEHVFVLVFHHIIMDAWSISLFFSELEQLYDCFCTGRSIALPPLPIRYTEWVVRQRALLTDPVKLERMKQFWTRALENAPTTSTFLPEIPRNRSSGKNSATLERQLDSATISALKDFARINKTTLFPVLLSTFKLLLSRHSGQRDLVIGTPTSGRHSKDLERLIGCFLGTVPVRSDVDPDVPFRSFLHDVFVSILNCFDHQDLPFERLVELVKPDRSQLHSPIFQILFNYFEMESEGPSLNGIEIKRLNLPVTAAKYDLTLYVRKTNNKIVLHAAYNKDLYAPDSVSHWLDQFVFLLKQILEDPDRKLGDYSLVSPMGRQLIVDPSERIEEPTYPPVTSLISKIVRSSPSTVAIIQHERQWTYAELDAVSADIASFLVSQGLGPAEVVAVTGARCFGFIATLVGILRGRGVFVIFDPELPDRRKRLIAEESGASWSVSFSDNTTDLTWADSTIQDDRRIQITPEGVCPPYQPVTGLPDPNPEDRAYVFFTSGTTGKPKGIVGTHKGLSHFIHWERNHLSVQPDDRVANLTGFSFDVILRDIFLPLTSGAALCLPGQDLKTYDTCAISWLSNSRITILHTVPSVVQTWLDSADREESLPALRCVLIAGEPLTAALVRTWRSRYGDNCRIFNLYGTTETTMAKCCHEIPQNPVSGIQPVGRPIPQTQILIFGNGNRQCGIGEPGEVVIRTPFRTAGYTNKDTPSNRGFQNNPFTDDSGDLLYFTGDIGHLDHLGLLHVAGRIDDQVKIHGVRIEPSEIATLLEEHPDLRHCVAIPVNRENGETVLAAYFILDDTTTPPTTADLRGFLKSRVPEYMIPSVFIQMTSMPLNRNGKLDRKALPHPDIDGRLSLSQYAPPRNLTEAILVQTWKSVLSVGRVGIHDDFFEIGGHSLLATRVISRLKGMFHHDIPLKSLFNFRTIDSLGARIRLLQTGEKEASATQGRLPEPHLRPASYAQQRMWFQERLQPGDSPYLMGASVELTGQLDYAALQLAVDAIVDRHESFRTTFVMKDGDPLQAIAPRLNLEVGFHDLAERNDPDGRKLRLLLKSQSADRFHLDRLPLVRISVIRLEETRHIFSWCCHHIISDGWSMSVFYRELRRYYNGFTSSRPYNPPALKVQYADFSEWQQKRMQSPEMARQVAYWKKKLENIPAMDLPGESPRPARQSFTGSRQRFKLPDALTGKLDAFNSASGTTPFMTLMAAFQLLLSRYTASDDIVTGTPIANRNELSYEDVIGCFVNTLAFRTDLSKNPSFNKLVSRVRSESLDAFDNQDVPFEHLVRELNPVRDPSRHPFFQVIFALQNASTESLSLGDLETKPYTTEASRTRFDLELHMSSGTSGYTGVINYCTDLFSTEYIELFIQRFIRLLEFFLDHPDRKVGDWSLADPAETRMLLIEWNPTERACALELPINEHFSRQAAATPQAIAIEQDGLKMDYRELDKRTNQLARYLAAGRVSIGDRVGICMERSLDYIVAILAVLKAGAAYVPLARDYPATRLQYMLHDASLGCILHAGQLPDCLASGGVETIDLSSVSRELSALPVEALSIKLDGDQPAYVIFTSGSTGQPKGTVIPHKGVVRLVRGQDYADFSPAQKFLFLASPSFDASTFEIWAPLLNGATCVIHGPTIPDLQEIEETIIRHQVNTAWLTAGLFNMIVDTWPSLLGHLKHVLTGGEALSPTHVRKALFQFPNLRITNGYGPTESTTFACTHSICKGDLERTTIPIGRPIANTQVYLVDKYMHPVPPGIPGELLLGGEGLAQGYLNDPRLTKERFIPNPFLETPGERLYRTGDICRFLPDGCLDFIGRNDKQIKVRGFRIELGEIESVCMQHGGVERVTVVPSQDASGTLRLVAYFVPAAKENVPDTDALRHYLLERLPAYAVPAFLCRLDALPLNANGKVDLRALPDPVATSRGDAEKPPQAFPASPVERELISVWKKLFEVDHVSPTDNFFDLGGHSLLAAKMLSQIEPIAGEALPVAALFESPTIRELAARLAKGERSKQPSSLVVLQAVGGKNPLYCIHGWGGDVYGFLDLGRHLAPERPVFGLQAVGLDGATPKHATVEEMARHYASEIVSQHDDRPVNLIGYSAGGWIAYAVAQELHSLGKSVNLAMLDTGMSSRIPYWIYFLTKLAHLFSRLPHHLGKWWLLPAHAKRDYFLERCRWLRVGITRNTEKMPSSREPDGSIKAYENDYFIGVAGRYRPKPYKGDLILFSAKGKRWYSHLFWKFMIRGKIEIHFVDGGHHGIIDRYHVGNFATLFQEVLDKLDKADQHPES